MAASSGAPGKPLTQTKSNRSIEAHWSTIGASVMFDLSGYRIRKLDEGKGYKPLDFGGNGIAGSINRDGRIIAVNAYHAEHGYMTLTSAPPFPDEDRYNPAAVRAYRESLAKMNGYGLEFKFPIVSREAYLIEDAVPYLRFVLKGGITAECITLVTVEEPVGVMQIWKFSEAGIFAKLSGKMWLQRAAYTQLTEGGVISMPPIKTRIVPEDNGYTQQIRNEALNASVHIRTAPLREAEDGSVEFYEDTIHTRRLDDETLPHGAQTYVFNLGIDRNSFQSRARYMHLTTTSNTKNLYDSLDRWKRRWSLWKAPDTELELICKRALAYGLMCCVPIDSEAVCIITDHMLLPLSWNRDAYYVAMALLRWNYEARDKVRGHLIWMFERAERVDRTWGRAYTVRGKVKDKGFQLDQQIFPLLELANYVLKTDDEEIFERLQPHILPTLDMLLSRRVSRDTWLFATEETPADDPIALPYHFSSHVLLWRTLRQLGKIYRRDDFEGLAQRIYRTIEEHFVTGHNGGKVYAYATDGKGNHHLYHDANDVPLALMPQWGFCPVDDPIWRNTIKFAWSQENRGGVYHGMLGSVHTQAPWPLGDAQELIIGRIMQDEARYEAAKRRLNAAAQWDGALPEAYSAQDYSVVSRHWFAWTNAMVYYFDDLDLKAQPRFGDRA